jgi:hypothetical protein
MEKSKLKSIQHSVGKGGVNSQTDLRVIIDLLNERKKDSYYFQKMNTIKIPKPYSKNLAIEITQCIYEFQKEIQKLNNPDGLVSPSGNTILFLGGVRNQGKHIIVDIDDQNLYAFNGSIKVHSYYCATGDKKHPTAIEPSLHRVFRKHEDYTSKKYNAPMDYAMFFTHDGKAIHQSSAVGITSLLKDLGFDSLGSKGCVRLSEDNAKELFNWTPMNTPVFIDMA